MNQVRIKPARVSITPEQRDMLEELVKVYKKQLKKDITLSNILGLCIYNHRMHQKTSDNVLMLCHLCRKTKCLYITKVDVAVDVK